MSNVSKPISFNIFYLTEFFNKTIDKSKEVISSDNYEKLKELAGYLIHSEDIISGLEKLAQYQGTNEFAIFLFDMMDHIDDYSATIVYDTLPDLVEDFVNLYSLMIEDPESIEAVDNVLTVFKDSIPEIVEPVKENAAQEEGAELLEMPAEEAAMEPAAENTPLESIGEENVKLLSLKEFYFEEVRIVIDKKIDTLEPEKRTNYSEIFHIFSDFNKNTKKEEQEAYDDEIKEIVSSVNRVFPKQFKKSSALDSIAKIGENSESLLERIYKFEADNPERFFAILESNKIVTIDELSIEDDGKEKKEPASIDNLLAEYFNTEVDDHLQTMKKLLNALEKESTVKKKAKKLKDIKDELYALKELCMIHGYSGFEYVTSTFAGKLDVLLRGELFFNAQFSAKFDKILESLFDVDAFVNADNSSELYKVFNERCDELIDYMKSEVIEDEITEEAEIVESESIEEEPEDDNIAFSETDKIYLIVNDLLKQSAKAVKGYQAKLKNKKSQKELFYLLDTLALSTSILDESLAGMFWQPLISMYEKSIETAETNYEKYDLLWGKLIDNFKNPLDMEAISALVGEGDGGLHSFDIAVLAAAYKKYWLFSVSDKLNKILENDAESKNEIEQYFSGLLQNIALFKLDNYRGIIEKIGDYFNESEKLNSDSIGELSDACLMVLGRMEQNGVDGDCSDIADKLNTLFSVKDSLTADEPEKGTVAEELPEEKEAAAEPLSEEEEVEKIFLDEAVDHLEKAQTALNRFEDDKKRSNIVTIENEIHTIKSSALLLDKKRVIEITNSIEDVAELFGQSSIPFPDNLAAVVRSGLIVLGELLKDSSRDIEKDVDALDSLLDQVVIDETAEASSEKEHRFETVVSTEKNEKISENVDDELQEIFKQETEANIIALEDSIKILRENPNEIDALDEFESSIHSIKSAAKMLGFKEIGQLSDGIESVIEDLRAGSITISEGFCASLRESIDVVKKLSLGESVNAADLTRISAVLNSRQFPVIDTVAKDESEERFGQESDDIGAIFLEEAGELMEQLNGDAIQLEKKPDDDIILGKILRNLHTLKGSSLMSGYERFGDLCHKLEDYLEEYSRKDSRQKAKMLDPVFDVLDILQDMLKSLLRQGTDELPGLMAKISAIDNRIFQIQDKTVAEDAHTAGIKPAQKSLQSLITDDNVIKVSTTYLDSLVNMSTELVVNRTGLSSHMKKLKELLGDADLSKRQIRKIENTADELFGSEDITGGEGIADSGGEHRDEFSRNLREFTGKINQVIKGLNRLFEDIDRDVNRIDSVSKVLHHDILKARMVPIASLFNRYPKAVHDLARKQDKKINFETTDNNAELDRAMVSALSDPILHILRNAVDHGVETPEERIELGKSEESNISIIARQGKSQVIIDIIDDGRGIDIDKVKDTIIKNELATAEDVDKMGESEVLDHIFHSGFSTKETISNISGRGIGLDVVASQLQKLKGNIRVRTEKNIGTTFSLRVPLTLTISQALLIRSNDQTLALPLFAVKETIEMVKDMVVEEDGKKFVKVRGALLPYVKLDELLNFGQKGAEEVVHKILVVTDAGVNIALGVSEVVNRQEIVIKTLGSLLQSVDYISGGTILGDGEVCLLLDYSLIVRTVELHTIGRETGAYALKSERKILRKDDKNVPESKKNVSQIEVKKISDRKPKIMIVDDSRSVLNFVSAILDDNHMESIKSSSGIEALAQMEEEDVDLLITDLEMPKMHGFELVQKIRKNEKFDKLPILILTGRDTKADREKAINYGANEFINKPFKERELLKVMEKFIQIDK